VEPRSKATRDRSVRFGRYALDPEGLWRGRQEVRLTPKALAVLRVLLERAGQLVTKEDLLGAAWPGTAVSDAALNSCIQEIRRALHDDAKQPRYLATIHRRGYRFVAITAEEPRPTRSPPALGALPRPAALVGRDRELEALHRWLALADAGQRQVVFVSGEPGIGKTTLVEAFLDEVAAAASPGIGRGQCVEHYGAGEAYLPILEALGRLCREPNGGERVVQVLARCAPTWLTQMPSLVSAAELRAVQRKAQGATRERMLRELAEAIEALTAETTLILRLEDLHWSDVSTLDWLACVARRPERARLLLIGTYRPVEVLARDHPLHAVKQELQLHRHCRELSVRSLEESAVAEYLARRCPVGTAQTAPLNKLACAIHARTEGNPLFMVNVVDDLVVREVLVDRGGEWILTAPPEAVTVAVPADIRQMIERQLAWLKPEQRHLLDAASVVGAEFSAAAVAGAAPAPAADVEECFAALGRREQFLRPGGTERWPDGTIATRYHFLHALYREVLYDHVPAGLRAALHARAGARLEAAHGTHSAEIAAGLAMHFERSGDTERAIAYFEQAGRNAVQRAAPREATMHLGRALELLATLPATQARAEGELSLQVALGTQLMTIKGWAAPEVERAYGRARTLCQEVGDTPQLFPALWGLWLFSWGRGDVSQAKAIADDLLARAERTDDTGLRLQGHHALWLTQLCQGELAAAYDHAARGIALYDAESHAVLASVYGNHDAGTCCRMLGAWMLGLLGFPERAVALSREAIALAERLGHPFNLAWAHLCAAHLRQLLREAAAARRHAEAALVLAREHGFPLTSGWATAVRGWAIAAAGAGADGIAEIRDGLAGARATGTQSYESYMLGLLAEACLMTERVEEGLAAIAEGLAMVARTGERFYEAELWRLRGELLLLQESDAAAAADSLVRAAEIARQQDARWLELRAAISLNRLQQRQGRTNEARRLLADVYGWFTEGLATADMREAAALLES
jgi:predicted ATPase/DNA-binding winged helix-turn-helix (wHTH) protein